MRAYQTAQVVKKKKKPPANAGDAKDVGLSLGQEDHLEEAWQPTPVFWPGESHGQRNLGGYSPWGLTELDTTEHTQLIWGQITHFCLVMSPCRRRQTCPCPPTGPACVNWCRSFGSTSTSPCALALCHENANHVSQRHRTFTLNPAVRKKTQFVCAPEQTDAQHQADSQASGGSSGLPKTWALAHPCPLVPAASGSSPGPEWLPRHWTPVSPCCPRTTTGSNTPDASVVPRSQRLPQIQALTHPSICWLQQPQVVSMNASSLPTAALGGFHDPRQLPDTCLPMDFSQSRPLITEPANSHGTRLLTAFWELRMKKSKEILWAL